LISVLRSLVSLSSPAALWTMVNQIQLILLLILTKTSIPDRVYELITSNAFSSFSFEFLKVDKISFIDVPKGWLETDQGDEDLEAIGVEYFHTYNNIFSLILIIIFAVPLHIII